MGYTITTHSGYDASGLELETPVTHISYTCWDRIVTTLVTIEKSYAADGEAVVVLLTALPKDSNDCVMDWAPNACRAMLPFLLAWDSYADPEDSDRPAVRAITTAAYQVALRGAGHLHWS